MQQINLELDDDPTPSPTLTPNQIQTLIKVMADAIIAVLENVPGADHESE